MNEKVIHRYDLNDPPEFLPLTAQFLHLEYFKGSLCFWVEYYKGAYVSKVEFHQVATGSSLEEGWIHIGTHIAGKGEDDSLKEVYHYYVEFINIPVAEREHFGD